jgi:hypothetical protein
MAYYSIFPEKDTTLYSHPDRINMNTGGDEILELVEEKATTGETYFASRILIKFKSTEIRDVIENKLKFYVQTGNGTGAPFTGAEVTPNTVEVSLNLFAGENKRLTSDHTLVAFPLSQSFDEGTQRYDANPPSVTTGSFQPANGATWMHRTMATSSTWAGSGMGASGSYSLQIGGGIWYTGSAFRSETTFLSVDNLDLEMDVTSVIQKYSASFYQSADYPTGIPNNGFIIKKPREIEEDGFGFGQLQYFSSDTHTIYPPKLTFKWDDSFRIPTSLSSGNILRTGDVFLALYNNKGEFQRKSKQRFRLTVRKRYPDRTFVTTSNYLATKYLPRTSYYSVRDAETDEVIIPFDTEYTKLSADSEGMFFDLWMEGFQPERYYKLMFRVDNSLPANTFGETSTNIYDEDYIFKVVR